MKRSKGWIHLQPTRIAVAFSRWNLFYCFRPKKTKNSNPQMRQLYAYLQIQCYFKLMPSSNKYSIRRAKEEDIV